MDITITLTDEQGAIIKDEIQKYAETLANDRMARRADRENVAYVKVLMAKTPEEIKEAAAPIIAAEKAKLEETPIKEG